MRGGIRWVVVLFCLLVVGCSILLDPADATQCRVDSDCESDPTLHGRVCVSGICARPAGPGVPVAADGGPGCEDNATCTKANSNKASVCKVRGGSCTQWQTEQCNTIVGNWGDPNAIMIGAVLPLTFKQLDGSLPEVPYAKREMRAMVLAAKEFGAALPSGFFIGSTYHPLALLVCDSSGDPERANAAFTHLTDVVGAQAIIMGYDDDLAAVSAKAAQTQVAITCSDCLSPLPPGPLAWRIAPPIAAEAAMIKQRVLDLAVTIGTAPPALKVTLITEPGRSQDAFRTALDLGFTYQTILTPDGRVKSFQPSEYVQKVLDQAPQILVVAMGPDFPKDYIRAIEDGWNTPAGLRGPKPHYLLTDLSRDSVELWEALIAEPGRDELRTRISGSRPYQSAELKINSDNFRIDYKKNADANFEEPGGNELAYDAFYAMAYAIASATSGSSHLLDGQHISAGFENLVGGAVTIDFGPGPTINTALGLLTNGAKVNLRGLYSTLDWNTTTRDLPDDVGTWCFVKNGSGVDVLDNAGLRYTGGTFSGAFGCPYP